MLLLANAVTLGLVAAPGAFWPGLLRIAPVELTLALSGSFFVVLASELARESWTRLSFATLKT